MAAPDIPLPDAAQGLALIEYLGSGHTLAASMGQTVGSLEALYHLGYTLFEQAKYKESMRVFAYLMTANHMDRRFFNGFAACLHMQGNHRDAIKYYGVASILDLTDPEPPMHMAECHLALGDRAEARNSIAYGLSQARAHENHHGFVPRLEAMLEFMDGAAAAPASHTEPTELVEPAGSNGQKETAYE